MADYPVTDIHISSTMIAITDNHVNVGPNGSVRVASNNTAYDSYNFNLLHRLVSTDIKNSILTHYDSHRMVMFDYECDIDENTYLCLYVGEPSAIWIYEDVWDVKTVMIGH